MIRKQKGIELLGEKIILSERTARQVFIFMNLDLKPKTETEAVFNLVSSHALIIKDSVSHFINEIPGYLFIKKARLRRKFTVKNMMKYLSPKQIAELAKEIMIELEGYDPDLKKKVKGASPE